MKVRFAKEIKEINEMLLMFRETKTKCRNILNQLKDDQSCLEEYKTIERLFNLDLSILDRQHLAERKNKLMQAIDKIMILESSLSIKKARFIPQNEQYEEDEKQYTNVKNGFKQFNNFSELIKKDNIDKTSKQGKSRQTSIVNYDQKRFNAVLGKLCFNPSQLNSIWIKNKPILDQPTQDKLDRLSKIIGNLKKNARSLYEEQRFKTTNINLLDYEQYNTIVKQLQTIKKENEELKSKINTLKSQNQILKSSNPLKNGEQQNLTYQIIKKSNEQSLSNYSPQNLIKCEEYVKQQTIIQNQNFKIIKYWKHQLKIESPSFIVDIKQFDNQKSAILKEDIDGNIGDSVLQCITQQQVKHKKEYFSNSNQLKTMQDDQVFEYWSSKRINTQSIGDNVKQFNLFPSNLGDVESKLKQIRQNRKKIKEDEDLWNQVENMKI